MMRGTTATVAGTSTDEDVLRRVVSLAGGKYYAVTAREAHWKPAWVWTLYGKLAVELMRTLQPRMCLRRSAKIGEVLAQHAANELARREKREQLTAKRANMHSLRSTGLTHREIAEIIGVERSTVSHELRKTSGP